MPKSSKKSKRARPRKPSLKKRYEVIPRVSVRAGPRARSGYPAPVPHPVVARINRLRVPVAQLTWTCPPDAFDFRTTREVPPLKGILGQRQALKTLRMALSMTGPGYNLFVCGLGGVDSSLELVEHIRKLRLPWTPPPDRCFVQNFRDPLRPVLLEFPPGEGPKFAERIHSILLALHRGLETVPDGDRRKVARGIIRNLMPSVRDAFSQPAVRSYLKDWEQHLLENTLEAVVEDYEVNCLSQGRSRGMPVIFERNPTTANLFGWVGRRHGAEGGAAPHFSEVHPGSLLQADGGVLVVNANDFQGSMSVWSALKSCLKYGQLAIDDSDGSTGRPSAFHPDPISTRTKVILIGDFVLYDHLFEVEPDLREVFKIRLDFDSEVDLNSKLIKRDYPAFLSKTCKEHGLKPVSSKGVARALEYGVRKAGRKNKVTAQTWLMTDLLREADYWCRTANRRAISNVDIDRALREEVLRLNLLDTKLAEMIHEGTILIATSGLRVGQVNGLTIYDMGDYLFAKPSRITAETSVGQGGIINIEREAGFSGSTHDKGVHILAGYLRSLFAQVRPLSLTASVCFEQSYSGIDGDSASATEIYAILSSLSGLPIRQDIAVTGSLNQKGDVQPVGGVNEKIEGFFDCVRAARPTGFEGVIIPRKNLKDLVLRSDVVEAVKKGRFHIFAIDNIEQGIEILTGVPAGKRLKSGKYTAGSVFDLADKRLEEIAQGLRRYQDHEEG